MPEPPAIVIVEDDAFIQRLYEVKFKEAGFSVHLAGDGEAGLKQVRDMHPAAVLLDVELPKLDGFAVLKALKADPSTSAIPVVMLTNSSTQGSVDAARSLGAADYLIKAHFLPSEVVAKVQKLLGFAG